MYEGEPLEVKIRKAMNENKPITDGTVPLIYTDKKNGVMPAYDIRTDRFEIARQLEETRQKMNFAKRDELIDFEDDQDVENGTDSQKNTGETSQSETA